MKYADPDARPIPPRETHKHVCGHYDACYPKRQEDPCIQCRRDAFNRSQTS